MGGVTPGPQQHGPRGGGGQRDEQRGGQPRHQVAVQADEGEPCGDAVDGVKVKAFAVMLPCDGPAGAGRARSSTQALPADGVGAGVWLGAGLTGLIGTPGAVGTAECPAPTSTAKPPYRDRGSRLGMTSTAQRYNRPSLGTLHLTMASMRRVRGHEKVMKVSCGHVVHHGAGSQRAA